DGRARIAENARIGFVKSNLARDNQCVECVLEPQSRDLRALIPAGSVRHYNHAQPVVPQPVQARPRVIEELPMLTHCRGPDTFAPPRLRLADAFPELSEERARAQHAHTVEVELAREAPLLVPVGHRAPDLPRSVVADEG